MGHDGTNDHMEAINRMRDRPSIKKFAFMQMANERTSVRQGKTHWQNMKIQLKIKTKVADKNACFWIIVSEKRYHLCEVSVSCSF